MKKVIMMMAVAMMTACSGKVDNAMKTNEEALPVDTSKPLRLAVAGVTHGHVGEVAGRVGRGDFEVVGVSEENDTYRADNPLSSKVPSEVFYKSLTEMLDQTVEEIAITDKFGIPVFASINATPPMTNGPI